MFFFTRSCAVLQVELPGCAVVGTEFSTCFCPTRRREGRRGGVGGGTRPHGVQSPGGCHVFLPLCQGQSVSCQSNMENKPEELQLCFKTRGSFEAALARKPWPHLAASCYGELAAWWEGHTHNFMLTCQVYVKQQTPQRRIQD